MAVTNNIVLKGNYSSSVVLNKPLSANGETVSLSSVTDVVRDGSEAENSSVSLGEGTVATGKHSLADGLGTKALGNYSVSLGVSAETEYERSFVWSGVGTEKKTAKGIGTFNVWPEGGSAGFYVGGTSLDRIIAGGGSHWATLSGNQTFIGNNSFAQSVTVSGITLNANTDADFSQGNLTVSDRDEGNSTNYAANTRFVTNALMAMSADFTKALSDTISEKRVCELIEAYLKKALGDSVIG